jgi:hypothetical protein
MSRLVPRMLPFAALGLMVVFATGGCPVTESALLVAPGADQPANSITSPGTYWVEQAAAKLRAYEPPVQRNVDGQWIGVASADASWFSGPAFYTLADDLTWSRAHEFDGLTLDDLLQVYDARAVAP